MSFKVGDLVLVRWLGKTAGYVRGTTWYNATVSAKRGSSYDIDYQDEIGTVELDVPEIRIIRNIPGDDAYIQQQINARNEEQKQLLKEGKVVVSKSLSSSSSKTKPKSKSNGTKNDNVRRDKKSDGQVNAYIASAIDPEYQVAPVPSVDPVIMLGNVSHYVGQRFEMIADAVWNLAHVESILGNDVLQMRWTGWWDEEWKFFLKLKCVDGVSNYYDGTGFAVELHPPHTNVLVYKAWIALPGTKPPIHWPGKVYVRLPDELRKKEANEMLRDENRLYVELYGKTASRPKLKPYSDGFWNATRNIEPIRCTKAWGYITEGEGGFKEGTDAEIATLFKVSFREMMNDPVSRDFQFVFEGAIEVAEEKERDAEMKRQRQRAEKEAKESARREMVAAKEKAKQEKLKRPCQLRHNGIPCGRTVEECVAFRKQGKEERSTNFASLNARKKIIPNAVKSRYRVPKPPKTILRKILQVGVDIESILTKKDADATTEKKGKKIWQTCSRNLVDGDDKTNGLMSEPDSGNLYKAVNFSMGGEENNTTIRRPKRKDGPCMHLEIGRDNTVKFLSDKFARRNQRSSNHSTVGYTNASLRPQRQSSSSNLIRLLQI